MVAVDKGREMRGNNLTVAHDSLMAHGFIFGLFASPTNHGVHLREQW